MMIDKPKTLKLRSPEFWKSAYGSHFEPHWAIQILLDPDPKGIDLPELVRDGEYPIMGSIAWESVTPERAMESFDKATQGWVPYWFPRALHPWEELLAPSARLAWFDRALGYHVKTEWPPEVTLSSRQRSVTLSLLHMLYAQESNGIPTPDEMG